MPPLCYTMILGLFATFWAVNMPVSFFRIGTVPVPQHWQRRAVGEETTCDNPTMVGHLPKTLRYTTQTPILHSTRVATQGKALPRIVVQHKAVFSALKKHTSTARCDHGLDQLLDQRWLGKGVRLHNGTSRDTIQSNCVLFFTRQPPVFMRLAKMAKCSTSTCTCGYLLRKS